MTEPSPKPVRTVQRGLTLAARLALAVLTLGAGVYVIETFAGLTRGGGPSPPPPEAPPSPAETLADSGIPEGGWALAGQPFRLRTIACPEAELAGRLTRPPAADAADAPADPAVLALLTARGTRRPGAEWIVYMVEEKDLRVCAFTRERDGREHWAMGRVAFRDREGGWGLAEATPAPGDVAGGRLLPLPAGASTLAARTDERGQCWSELVTVPGGVAALRAHWGRAGWELHPSESGGVCRRGGEAVRVWDLGAGGGGGAAFLIREQP